MALKKKKITRNIWIDGERWKVEDIISPTKNDDYIVVSRRGNCVHMDGQHVVQMDMIDPHNHTFYPDTKAVREQMDKLAKVRQQLRDRERKIRDALTEEWLACFKHNY